MQLRNVDTGCMSNIHWKGFSNSEKNTVCSILQGFPTNHWAGLTFAKSYENVGLCGRYIPEFKQVTLFDREGCPEIHHVIAHEVGHHVKEKYVNHDLFTRASFDAMMLNYPGVVVGQLAKHGTAAEHETVAEIYREFVTDPKTLRRKAPGAYNWMSKNIFKR